MFKLGDLRQFSGSSQPDKVVVPEINNLEFDVAQIISEFESREQESSNNKSVVNTTTTPGVVEVNVPEPENTDSNLASG